VIAQQQGLQGGFAVFDSAWCEFDYCSSDWALYSGDQNDPNSNIQFLEIFPCQSWSDFCYSGSGGGGGAGEGNDDGTCYIRFNADCPIECRICIRIPAPAY
jgi:hypothetical protein